MTDLIAALSPFLPLMAATGIGVAAGGALAAVFHAPRPRLERFVPQLVRKAAERKVEVDWRALVRDPDSLWFLVGAVSGGVLAGGSRWLPTGLLLGGAAGLLARRAIRWVDRRARRWRRLQQTAVLYEVVELYSQLGYPIYDCLQAASFLLPELYAPVQRCLRRWGQGPIRALQQLGQELEVDEAEILVAVLQQAYQVGETRLGTVLAEEARQLEALRQRVAEEQLSMRPLFLTVYTALPGFALIGILFFPLALRIISMLSSIRVG